MGSSPQRGEGLPPIRLHDLHHGAAPLAHAAGAGLKDIQEMLSHSSFAIMADTYTSLLTETDQAAAARRRSGPPRPGRTSKQTRNPEPKP